MERATDKWSTHLPPSQPIRFLPTAQHEAEDREGGNDTEEDTNQDIEGETQQESPAPECSEEYL